MPKWLHDLILCLKANEVLLSSISSFIAITVAIIGGIGFVFGWWQRLWRSLSNKKNKSGSASGKETALETNHPSSNPDSIFTNSDEVEKLTSITLPSQTHVLEKVYTTIDHTSSSTFNQNTISKLTHEMEAYLEKLESDVLEGFRVDQYIDLTLETLASEDAGTLHALQHALQSTFEVSTQEWPKGGDALPLETAIGGNRLVVLLGDAGSGKTTSLRYIILRQIQGLRYSSTEPIPVWISLGNWLDKNVSVIEFLWQEYSRLAGVSLVSKDDFRNSVEQGDFFFVLDGLNELPQRDRPELLHEEQFKDFSKQHIVDRRENDLFVLARNTRSRFMLSCRLLDYAHQPGWHEFRVLPLSNKQILELAQKSLDRDYRAFQEILIEQPALQGVIRTPFLLRSLIRLVQEGLTIRPSDRFELVEFVCRSAIARESMKLQVDTNEMTEALGHMAWQLMNQGSIGSFFTLPLDSSLMLELDNDKKIRIIDALDWGKSTGLFILSGFELDGTPRYRFPHQLIQEALVISYLQYGKEENHALRRANALLEIGQLHAEWGLLNEAEDNLQRALELCPISESLETRSKILLGLSDVYRQWRRSIYAIPLVEQAVELLDSQNLSKLLASACYGLGLTYARIRKPYEAEKFYSRAYRIYQKLGDDSVAAYTSVFGLADLYSSPWHLYRPKQAFEIYHNAIEVFQETADQLGVARVQLAMAHLYRLQGEIETSLTLFSQCEQSFHELNHPWLRLRALGYGGILLRDAWRHEEAIEWGQRAQKLAEELGALNEQVNILVYIRAWTASHQGKHLEALEWVKQAHLIVNKLSSSEELCDLYRAGFGTTYWRAKNFSEAAKFFILYKREMDYEERIHISGFYKAAIRWAELVGQHVSTNPAAKLASEVCWWIISSLEAAAVPKNWLGTKLFQFQWWLRRFVWIRT
ncbi:MAG: NACHT domain-containing protein [Anaerolineales bacterium]